MKNLTRTTLISLATVTALTFGAWATCADDVDMGEHKITNVADPVNDQDVATKKYVDDLFLLLDFEERHLFMRDDYKMVVSDSTTGLMWQDNEAVADSNNQKPWLTADDYTACQTAIANSDDLVICENTFLKSGTAQKYCFDLELGGYTDWRLPTKADLSGIIKKHIGSPAISSVFNYTSAKYYWSSTSYDGMENFAWVVSFGGNGVVYGRNKDVNLNVRCVRDGQ